MPASTPSDTAASTTRGPLLVVFLTVFIDLLGFGIVLPVMPRQAEPYLKALGCSPVATGAVIGVLFSLSLIWWGGPASALLGIPAQWSVGMALFFLSFHVVYLVATERVRGRWQWPRWLGGLSLKLPSGRFTRRQYLLGMIDVAGAAGILWMFLPETVGLSYLAFLPIYVLCIFAALASNVPAGLGVFESVLLTLLPHVPPVQLLGAMLLYRCVYEVLPLALAVLGLAAGELLGKGRTVATDTPG